jgi:hypothetical protein
MDNKELAFDYLYEQLYKDVNLDTFLDQEKNFTETDKNELSRIMAAIKDLSEKSQKYELSQTENGKKLEDLQTQNTIDAFTFNKQNVENTYNTIMSIKTSLQEVVKDATRAYNYIMIMYIVAFAVGIGLIVTSIVFAAQGKTILAVAFGSVGFIDLITTFFFKPPMEIQNSRSNLTQLMIIITNWFADLMNQNTYMSLKGQNITLEEMNTISDRLNNSTREMVQLIEEYSENRK